MEKVDDLTAADSSRVAVNIVVAAVNKLSSSYVKY